MADPTPWLERHALGVSALSILGGLVAWEMLARGVDRPAMLPAVTAIGWAAVELWRSGDLLPHVTSSYARILVGFLLGSLAGAVLGILMGTSRLARSMLEPLANFFRFVPPIAWLGVVLIWFGIGETSKVAIITYTTAFVVLVNTLAGVTAIPLKHWQVAQCLGASWWQVLRWVVFPATARHLVTGMHIALANSFATIVTAEMIAAETGLGYLILISRNYMATEQIFVGIATLGALGLCTSRAFIFGARRVVWRFFLDG
jgi:NitT/TauT family transport system permease protein